MQPSNLNDQLTKCWQAGVYPKSWQKKNEKKFLELDVDELIQSIGRKLEKDNLPAGQFGDLIVGTANILNTQVDHFLNRFKKSDDLKKKEESVIRFDESRPEGENIDILAFPEVNLDLNIPERDEHLLQEDIPPPNYKIVDDEGFGDFNYPEEHPDVIRDQFVDLSKGWNEGPSRLPVETLTLPREETESAVKSISKSVRFEDQPEISAAPEEISDITPGFVDSTRREVSELMISEIRSSPLQKSPMKQHIVTIDEIQLEDHVAGTPSLVQSLIRKSSPRKDRAHVHVSTSIEKPRKVPGKKLKQIKRYNKRGFKLYHPGAPVIDLDYLPLPGLTAEEKDIDHFYYGDWNDIPEFMGNREIADRDHHEILEEIYPFAPVDRSEERGVSTFEKSETVEPVLEAPGIDEPTDVPVLEQSSVEEPTEAGVPAFQPTTVDESMQDATTLEPPVMDDITPVGAPALEPAIMDEIIPADVPAFEPPVVEEMIPSEVSAFEPPVVEGMVPAEVPALEQPITDEPIQAASPADEPAAESVRPIQPMKQKKIIQRPDETVKLLELIIEELENQESVVFQEIYPESDAERNLAFYCLLYLLNDGELECQQDEHKALIVITIP